MDDQLLELGIALAIGLIVGLERGWRLRDEPEGSRVAGLRTFGLAGLLGGACAAVAESFGTPAVFAVGLVVFSAVFAWFEERGARSRNSYSVTATLAGVAVFILGGLAVSGDRLTAAAGGVAVACILASRDVIHGALQKLTWPEVRSALLLLAMTAIVLPVLPNRAIDPWGGFNPFEIWLFTIITAGISYAGYIAIKLVGPSRGTIAASLLGAVVSSTAVTVALGRRALNEGKELRFAGGASLAAMVSVLRVGTVVLLVKPQLIGSIIVPVLAAAATFGGAGILLLRRRDADGDMEAEPSNPFDLWPVLLFAGTFAIVSLISAVAVDLMGPDSVIATAAISAVLDVDVATLSAARLAGSEITLSTAAWAILTALAVNAGGRIGAAALAGPARYTRVLAAIAGVAFAVGTAAAILAGPV